MALAAREDPDERGRIGVEVDLNLQVARANGVTRGGAVEQHAEPIVERLQVRVGGRRRAVRWLATGLHDGIGFVVEPQPERVAQRRIGAAGLPEPRVEDLSDVLVVLVLERCMRRQSVGRQIREHRLSAVEDTRADGPAEQLARARTAEGAGQKPQQPWGLGRRDRRERPTPTIGRALRRAIEEPLWTSGSGCCAEARGRAADRRGWRAGRRHRRASTRCGRACEERSRFHRALQRAECRAGHRGPAPPCLPARGSARFEAKITGTSWCSASAGRSAESRGPIDIRRRIYRSEMDRFQSRGARRSMPSRGAGAESRMFRSSCLEAAVRGSSDRVITLPPETSQLRSSQRLREKRGVIASTKRATAQSSAIAGTASRGTRSAGRDAGAKGYAQPGNSAEWRAQIAGHSVATSGTSSANLVRRISTSCAGDSSRVFSVRSARTIEKTRPRTAS